jgi:hypothetical protein
MADPMNVAPTLPTGPAAAPTAAAAPVVLGPSCWALPDSGAASPLVDSDIEAAAKRLNVDDAAVYAVADVESGGRGGFDDQKRPRILFEVARFQDYTGGRFDKVRPDLSASYSSPARKESYAKDQWEVLHAAFLLDPDAAVKATSWGMFQVLGANMSVGGYTDTRTFVNAMFESEGNHLQLFMDFCRENRLVKYLQKQQWASFALRYNGKDYASNAYDVKLRRAFLRHGGVEPPPAPAVPPRAQRAR